jgi:elongation factor Ts
MEEKGILDKFTKKEALMKRREIATLERTFGGIKKMARLPDALFVIDVGYENIAVQEANKLGIPVIGLVDTNNSPDGVQYMIPSNDDAIRSIDYSLSIVSEMIQKIRAQKEIVDLEEVAQMAQAAPRSDKPSRAKKEKEPAAVVESVSAPVAPQETSVVAPEPAATISAADVKKLREMTGIGMMECKKALVQAAGDFDKAQEILEQMGLKKVAKAASRVAAEGQIHVISKDDLVALVEINCETDFVARDAKFEELKHVITQAITAPLDLETLLATKVDGKTVQEHIDLAITQLGEKIVVRRVAIEKSEDGKTGFYNHTGKIGAIVQLDNAHKSAARDLAMQIAAMNPTYVTISDAPAEVVAELRAKLTQEAQDEGKTADLVEEVVSGRLKKELSAVSLMEQGFIKNPDLSVAQWLAQEKVTLKSYTRFEVGEGIEKEHKDFAAEVAAQIKK